MIRIMLALLFLSLAQCSSTPEPTETPKADKKAKNAKGKKAAKKQAPKKTGETGTVDDFGDPSETFALDSENSGDLLDEDKAELAKKKAFDNPSLTPSLQKLGPGKSLPLPEKINLFAVTSFLDQYKDAYKSYMPLLKEYKLYFNLFAREVPAGDQEIESAKFRIKEDFARAHWTYVKGLHEMLELLTQRTAKVLIQDVEENFVLRMKVLTFLAKELQTASSKQDYIDFTRKIYISLSVRHFGRELEEVNKPASPTPDAKKP